MFPRTSSASSPLRRRPAARPPSSPTGPAWSRSEWWKPDRRPPMLPMRSLAAAALAAAALITALAASTIASPASGVTPTLLARGTYDSFNVKSAEGPQMFKAEAKDAIDVVIRRHDYAAGGSTGWHSPPCPVFITVVTGQLTFYDYDDPNCTPPVVTAGHGYVDSGDGH